LDFYEKPIAQMIENLTQIPLSRKAMADKFTDLFL